MSDVEAGFRSLQLSAGAAVASGLCGYAAAKQLSKPFVETANENRAMIFTGVAFAAVIVSAVYAFFVIYRASMRTKMFAVFALLLSLVGSYGGWTIGWKKGGDPVPVKVL